MRAGVWVTAGLALALGIALPAAVSVAQGQDNQDIRPANGRVVVRDIDRRRERDHRDRFERDRQRVDERYYHGERRGPARLRHEARGADPDNTVYSDGGSFVYLGEPAPRLSSGNRAQTDEFDNLVVYHGTGYKQIIIGGAMVLRRAGVEAADLFNPAPETEPDYGESPSVVYFDGSERTSAGGVTIVRPPLGEDTAVISGECVHGAFVVRGRSFMYALDRNQTPHLAGGC